VLFARYDLASLKGSCGREDLRGRVASMWRYAEVLPDLAANETPVNWEKVSLLCLPARVSECFY